MSGEHRGFKSFVVITVVSVYLLILAGGIVRTTGSGMGCPDWPKCFGRWVPPTEVNQLPPDYKERYKVHGYETEFNPVKTWIEYINRLLGALIGVFVIAAYVLSLKYKADPAVSRLCGLALLMVILEGVVGKYVVSTNLKPLLISFHLWGSILIIVLLIYVMCRVRKADLITGEFTGYSTLKKLNVLLILVTIIQMLVGTQVRQQIDTIAAVLGFDQRTAWLERLDSVFDFHRTFSIAIFLYTIYFVYRLSKAVSDKVFRRANAGLLFLLLTEMFAGIVMSNFNIPAFMQPIHMLTATMLLGIQFFILFVLELNKKPVLQGA